MVEASEVVEILELLRITGVLLSGQRLNPVNPFITSPHKDHYASPYRGIISADAPT